MSDKRGTWSKDSRNTIWEDYADRLIDGCYGKEIISSNPDLEDWKMELPCPWCGKRMLKSQYKGVQDVEQSWDIDHMNANPNDNSLHNLQPMHSECNKDKGNSDYRSIFNKYSIKNHECNFTD